MNYLIDTDWVIDYLHDVARVAERLAELSSDELGGVVKMVIWR